MKKKGKDRVFEGLIFWCCFIIKQRRFKFQTNINLLQPSVSGMDPPFGDAFQSHMFSEQTLISTDLLANNSDPDFMYELVSWIHLSIIA